MMGKTCSMQGYMTNAYNILVGNPKQKRQLGKHLCTCEDNNHISLRQIGLEIMEWIHLAEDRERWRALVYTKIKLTVP
jgi:hypothetical protein